MNSLVEHTVRRYGRLDLVVNNGGGQFPSAASNINKKGFNAVRAGVLECWSAGVLGCWSLWHTGYRCRLCSAVQCSATRSILAQTWIL